MRAKRANSALNPLQGGAHHLKLPQTVIPGSRRGPPNPFPLPESEQNGTMTDNVHPFNNKLFTKAGRASCASQLASQCVNPINSDHHMRLRRTVFPRSRREAPNPFPLSRSEQERNYNRRCPLCQSALLSTRTEKSGRIAPARSRMMGGENPCARIASGKVPPG